MPTDGETADDDLLRKAISKRLRIRQTLRMSQFTSVFAASLFALSLSVAQADEAPKPKYGPEATPVSRSHEYLQKAAAPDYWALSPYYLSQKTGGSCSVASVATVMNGLRASQALTADDELVTEETLLKKSGDKDWAARVGHGSVLSTLMAMATKKGGVTLDLLGKNIESALKAYGFTDLKVDVVHADQADAATLAKLKTTLEQNEKSAQDFMIINFEQGKLTGDTGGGHISPIGAYDAKADKVLVMDVDRQWYEPYWTSSKALLDSMATPDSESKRNRGYVWIHR